MRCPPPERLRDRPDIYRDYLVGDLEPANDDCWRTFRPTGRPRSSRPERWAGRTPSERSPQRARRAPGGFPRRVHDRRALDADRWHGRVPHRDGAAARLGRAAVDASIPVPAPRLDLRRADPLRACGRSARKTVGSRAAYGRRFSSARAYRMVLPVSGLPSELRDLIESGPMTHLSTINPMEARR